MDIPLKPQEEFWLFPQIIYKPENCLDCITGLWFDLAQVILVFFLGTTIPNTIGLKIVRWSGNNTSTIRKMAGKYPQKSYAAVVCEI